MRFTDNDGDHSTGFHVGGFLLGFFLGLIGIVIAYVAGGDDDVKRNRAKWAWIGFGAYVVIFLALLLSGIFSFGIIINTLMLITKGYFTVPFCYFKK